MPILKIDEDRRRMEWHADESNYRGWLEVFGEERLSRVIVHLSFGVEKFPAADPIVPDEPVRDNKPILGRDIEDDPISRILDGALNSLLAPWLPARLRRN